MVTKFTEQLRKENMTTKIKDNSAMTIANKTLSDKEIYFWDNKTEMYKKEDVKEFISIIKAGIDGEIRAAKKKDNPIAKQSIMVYEMVKTFIDIKAGDKLT